MREFLRINFDEEEQQANNNNMIEIAVKLIYGMTVDSQVLSSLRQAVFSGFWA